MGQQFLAYWRVWLALGLVVGMATDVLHTTEGARRLAADVEAAIIVVVVAFYVTGVVVRRRYERRLHGHAIRITASRR